MNKKWLKYLTPIFFCPLFFSHASQAGLLDKKVTESYYKSYRYEQVGDYSNAINCLLMINKETPKDYTANLRLGYLYFMNNSYANAAAHYQIAQTTAPTAMSPQIGLMRLMNTQNNYIQAEAIGYKILQLDLYNYYGNLYLAHALRMNKKFESAISINLKMLALYPSDTPFLLEYGLLTFAQGKDEQARHALEYLLVLDPENIEAKETLQTLNNHAMETQK